VQLILRDSPQWLVNQDPPGISWAFGSARQWIYLRGSHSI
jgi:hypothetical protein